MLCVFRARVVEDYYISASGLPLRITLDESVHWLDREYTNYTASQTHALHHHV